MTKKEIQVGDRLGHFEVLALHNEHHFGNSWLVKCDCGNEVVRSTSRLLGTPKRRPEKSCGCSLYAHDGLGVKNKKLVDVWYQMIRRCHNPNHQNYDVYGEKGIFVCEEWRNDYTTFYEWSLKNGYKDGLTIDRIDGTKGYNPNNCRWVDYYVQHQNKKVTKRSKTGITGVYAYDYGYKVGITRNGVKKDLGTFKTLQGATSARRKAEEHFEKYGTLEDYET
jgi:hypothetical protein